jgi:hypothetical protein
MLISAACSWYQARPDSPLEHMRTYRVGLGPNGLTQSPKSGTNDHKYLLARSIKFAETPTDRGTGLYLFVCGGVVRAVVTRSRSATGDTASKERGL